jgi:hypothetical protein
VTARAGVGEHRRVIRNVVIHVSNEQPLMADLFDLPTAEDAGLLCTSVRMMDGKRPVFIDAIDSTFFFPYHVVRFIEIPKGAVPAGAKRRRAAPAAADGGAPEPEPEAAEESLLPIALGAPNEATVDGELDIDLEIDEDFLQRVRDI